MGRWDSPRGSRRAEREGGIAGVPHRARSRSFPGYAFPMTERAKVVMEKAQKLGLTPEWVTSCIFVDDKTMTVAEAEMWVDGYRAGRDSRM